ncbi:MAG: hypothetical protein Q4G03_08805 [Planctomycetia bacterium]|nr:hypothetical protein [Planctomycetia bacterium]
MLEPNAVQPSAPGRKSRRKLCRFICISLAVALLAVVLFGYYRYYKAPMVFNHAGNDQALLWLATHDFSKEPFEERLIIFDFYYSKVAQYETLNPDEEPKLTKIALPNALRKYSKYIVGNRSAQVEQWRKANPRPPYLRIDYLIEPQTPRESRYILSTDVKPGPALKERQARAKQTVANARRSVVSNVERNIQLLVMHWFVDKLQRFDQAEDELKPKILEEATEELWLLQGFYNGIRHDAGVAELTRAQLLAEFEMTVESWNDLVSEEELAKVLWFKDMLEASAAAKEAPGFTQQYARSYPPTVDSKLLGLPEENSETKEKVHRALHNAREATRKYFFPEQ